MPNGHFRLECAAVPETAAPMRHLLAAFLTALDITKDAQIDIVTAAGEALANAVEHAYREGPAGSMILTARMEGDGTFAIDVVDRGTFVAPMQRHDRGLGLRIVRSIARTMHIDTAAGTGTTIRMVFDIAR
jgi:anti-sigma regulatory factor (Ser/Thr protein kinase)